MADTAISAENGQHVLVFNSGSSTLKFQLFEMRAGELSSRLRGMVRNFGPHAVCEWQEAGNESSLSVAVDGHDTAAQLVLDVLEGQVENQRPLLTDLVAIGHRVVHGGGVFYVPTRIDDDALARLEALSPLAPLHNPPAIAVMRACLTRLAKVPMVAVFDTAFFHNLPDYVRNYALPSEWRDRPQPIRRYGFHGLAHRSMAERYRTLFDKKGDAHRLITLQLGNGCSVAALADGKPKEISMGFTPMEGLIMSSRSGDLDPGVLIYLQETAGLTAEELNEGLNRRSGLLGLSGVSGDMQTLLQLESEGHDGARLAVTAFCHRLRKYIGAYLAVLGGADAIVFGGGIGEHAATIREHVIHDMAWCGVDLDRDANEAACGVPGRITSDTSSIDAYVVPVDEEKLVASDILATVI